MVKKKEKSLGVMLHVCLIQYVQMCKSSLGHLPPAFLCQLTGSPSMWGETLLKYVLLFFT